ncbi:MAG: diguanylate cyclase (GGDEF)-like protein [Urechidicola sp.]|jgi:diguanylate cyclase (GGDEF)-like protein
MLTSTMIVAFAIVFFIYVRAEKDIDSSNEIRLQSQQLADVWRQSADDRTRMVRSYAATSDPKYKQHYHEIVAIRDGEKVRPTSYDNVYWDLILGDALHHPADGGQPISLMQLMQQAGFTQSELAKLAEVKESSDTLISTELAAIKLIDTTHPLTEAVRTKAILMLQDNAYHQAKANIMRPVGEFNFMLNQRTRAAVNEAEKIALQLRLVLIILGVMVLCSLWITYQAIGMTLGTSLNSLHGQIEKIGNGGYLSIMPEDKPIDGSIIGFLLKTQLRLADIERERKQADGKYERIANYDLLTNLPNRALLADRLNFAMEQCQRHNRSLAVAFLDLDGFKAVNDAHGHNVGDELLITVSQRLKAALRRGDTLARIGGDEFIVVMVDLEKFECSEPVLERLLKAAADPVTVGDAVMQVSASIGVTLYSQNDVDADLLIRHADQAMYVAKQAGKNRYHRFDIVQDNVINIQRQNIANIRLALGRHEFVLHYQPKVNMHTGEVIGVEALIRWQHPDRGLVPPLEFLPVIESQAISLELGEWVIDTALNQISQWKSIGLQIPISVNISAYQLQQDTFITDIAMLLAAHPEVNPHYLELEILETSALNDLNKVSSTMNACQELGLHFALDDFGTGYSSLTYLKHLPAYYIKIDQSFVRDMLKDADDLAIIEGIIGLAKAFDREVIAEGVETIAHGVALLKLGCELAQGYGIARPMPASDIPQWASVWKADDAWQAVNLIEAKKSGHLA